MKLLRIVVLPLVAGCTFVPSSRAARCEVSSADSTGQAPLSAPRLDHHQHLLNEGTRKVTAEHVRSLGLTDYASEVEVEPLVDADALVVLLDSASIERALVLSTAYYYARSASETQGELDRVRAENDWTLAQVRRHPGRLFAACSVNPRRGYSVGEIERCARSGGFRALKLHFDASGVDLTNPEHVVNVRQAFETANRLRVPIIVHLQSEAGPFGGEQARTFLNDLMRAAPDVPVTINHLWGGGGYGRGPAEVLTVFAEAVQRGDPSTANLWFDVAQASMMVGANSDRTELAARMRQIGFARLLYGSDGPQWNGVPPKQHWMEFISCMPLTREELDSLRANVAPHLR